jgi:hypothetical protein
MLNSFQKISKEVRMEEVENYAGSCELLKKNVIFGKIYLGCLCEYESLNFYVLHVEIYD